MEASSHGSTPPSRSAPSQVPAVPPAELSERNRLRTRRLAEIRESIANGDYETTERLDAAVTRFLAEINGRA